MKNIDLKYAFRRILKNRMNSTISIVGLATALTCVMLIYLYVHQEINFNRFYDPDNRIYRLNYSLEKTDGTKNKTVLLNPELSETLKNKIPQIKWSTSFRSAHHPSLKFENQWFEQNLFITERDFFKIFNYKFVAGSKDEIFKNPNELVITSSLADKFAYIKKCKREDLIGESVVFKNLADQPFIISGIIEDIPENSSLDFDALIPLKYQEAFNKSNNWFGNSTIFYETNKNENGTLAETLVASLLKEYYHNLVEELKSDNILLNTPEAFSPFALPISDVYLSGVSTDYERSNNKTSLIILSSIGFLILVIACSNFVLLSIGQSFKDQHDMGIRKIIGAKISNVYSFFLTEKLIITMISLVIASISGYYLIPVFNQLAVNNISLDLISFPRITAFTLICMLFIVVSISFIPLFKLIKSPIKPASLTNRKSHTPFSASNLFVTLQYGLSIILIISTVFVVHQTNYLKHKDMGYSSKNIINLRIYHLENTEKIAFFDKLKSNTSIESLTVTDRDYVSGRGNNYILNDAGESIYTRILKVDKDYIPTLGLKISEGENFAESTSSNLYVIINEKLRTSLNLQNSAVGQSITLDGRNYIIKGIIKNYHYDSMKEEIEPLMLMGETEIGKSAKYFFIKYNPAQTSQVLALIRSTWKDMLSHKELDMNFWDEQLNNRYLYEEKWSKIIGYAAIMAIVISSLGLFGLTYFILSRRTKEIGIRRVNGARTHEILLMLNKEFLSLIVIAFIFACPIAWLAMHKWLQNFAYKTELSWWVFAAAGAAAVAVALLTVSWQSWRAATRNPVEALRYE
ncbi:MAG: ABC transporter permease [Bacteroidales bacterium]|nr:ABC transporter permease [Bacteroidales bacterium]